MSTKSTDPVAWVAEFPQAGLVTGQLDPVALTTICDELGAAEDVVVHPLNTLRPTALTNNIISICKPRRFLRPTRHRRPAPKTPANSGPDPCRKPAMTGFAGTVTVRVVGELASAATVTFAGLNAHVAPAGRNPEQLNAIVPLNAAFAVMVSVAVLVPTANGVNVTVIVHDCPSLTEMHVEL